MAGKHRAIGTASRLARHRTMGVRTVHVVAHVVLEVGIGMVAIRAYDTLGSATTTSAALMGVVAYLHV